MHRISLRKWSTLVELQKQVNQNICSSRHSSLVTTQPQHTINRLIIPLTVVQSLRERWSCISTLMPYLYKIRPDCCMNLKAQNKSINKQKTKHWIFIVVVVALAAWMPTGRNADHIFGPNADGLLCLKWMPRSGMPKRHNAAGSVYSLVTSQVHNSQHHSKRSSSYASNHTRFGYM